MTAVIRPHIADFIDHGAPLVAHRCFQEFVREHLGDVRRRRLDLESPPHLGDFFVQGRVDEILNEIDIVLVDPIARADTTLGISLDTQQFFRIGFADIAGLAHHRPERAEYAGGAEAACGFLEKMPAAVIKIVFLDMCHRFSPLSNSI